MVLVLRVLPASHEVKHEYEPINPAPMDDAIDDNNAPRCTSTGIDYAASSRGQCELRKYPKEPVATVKHYSGTGELYQTAPPSPEDRAGEWQCARCHGDPLGDDLREGLMVKSDKPVGLLGLPRVRTILVMFTTLSVRRSHFIVPAALYIAQRS